MNKKKKIIGCQDDSCPRFITSSIQKNVFEITQTASCNEPEFASLPNLEPELKRILKKTRIEFENTMSKIKYKNYKESSLLSSDHINILENHILTSNHLFSNNDKFFGLIKIYTDEFTFEKSIVYFFDSGSQVSLISKELVFKLGDDETLDEFLTCRVKININGIAGMINACKVSLYVDFQDLEEIQFDFYAMEGLTEKVGAHVLIGSDILNQNIDLLGRFTMDPLNDDIRDILEKGLIDDLSEENIEPLVSSYKKLLVDYFGSPKILPKVVKSNKEHLLEIEPPEKYDMQNLIQTFQTNVIKNQGDVRRALSMTQKYFKIKDELKTLKLLKKGLKIKDSELFNLWIIKNKIQAEGINSNWFDDLKNNHDQALIEKLILEEQMKDALERGKKKIAKDKKKQIDEINNVIEKDTYFMWAPLITAGSAVLDFLNKDIVKNSIKKIKNKVLDSRLFEKIRNTYKMSGLKSGVCSYNGRSSTLCDYENLNDIAGDKSDVSKSSGIYWDLVNRKYEIIMHKIPPDDRDFHGAIEIIINRCAAPEMQELQAEQQGNIITVKNGEITNIPWKFKANIKLVVSEDKTIKIEIKAQFHEEHRLGAEIKFQELKKIVNNYILFK
ncbi:MAG: hypothetical protein ACFFAS_06955 [Promethearchaeota archaeon]